MTLIRSKYRKYNIKLQLKFEDISLYNEFSAGSGACYFPGRSADIFLWGEKVGSMGVIHPNTLKAFELPNPVSVLELNLEPFL